MGLITGILLPVLVAETDGPFTRFHSTKVLEVNFQGEMVYRWTNRKMLRFESFWPVSEGAAKTHYNVGCYMTTDPFPSSNISLFYQSNLLFLDQLRRPYSYSAILVM